MNISVLFTAHNSETGWILVMLLISIIKKAFIYELIRPTQEGFYLRANTTYALLLILSSALLYVTTHVRHTPISVESHRRGAETLHTYRPCPMHYRSWFGSVTTRYSVTAALRAILNCNQVKFGCNSARLDILRIVPRGHGKDRATVANIPLG